MKILKPKAAGLVGAVAVVTIASQAQAQATATVTMGVAMTISQAASASASQLSFGSVIPLPNGSITLTPAGVLSGGLGSTSPPAAGVITVTRSADITVSVTPPDSVSLTCGTSTVTVDTFTSADGATSCATAATGSCSILIGARATFPATTMAVGACTPATATMTLTYSP